MEPDNNPFTYRAKVLGESQKENVPGPLVSALNLRDSYNVKPYSPSRAAHNAANQSKYRWVAPFLKEEESPSTSRGGYERISPGLNTSSPVVSPPLSPIVHLEAIQRVREGFSRKVFIGGLPVDLTDGDILNVFAMFGEVVIERPLKEPKTQYPTPLGYLFLVYKDQSGVQKLLNQCYINTNRYFFSILTKFGRTKRVEVVPWNLGDESFVLIPHLKPDPRKIVFIGGLPKTVTAQKLATLMNETFGNVISASLFTDAVVHYPKGCGRVYFGSAGSYDKALQARLVKIDCRNYTKTAAMKPYILNAMRCDICYQKNFGEKSDSLYCAAITCKKYFCVPCWNAVHWRHDYLSHRQIVRHGRKTSKKVEG